MIPQTIPLVSRRPEIWTEVSRILKAFPGSKQGSPQLAAAILGPRLSDVELVLVDVATLFPVQSRHVSLMPSSLSRILVVGLLGDTEAILAALNEGIHVYVLQETGAQTMARLMEMDSQVSALHFELGVLWGARVRRLLVRRAEQAMLTRQESAVLRLMQGGLGNPQIAGALRIEHKTVKNHVTSIFRKLGVKNRYEAIAAAAQTTAASQALSASR